MNQPNIVFFFTDDQRFDTIGNLNNPEIYTPNLDQIVSEGTTFVNSYIMGGSCGAVCMPSRGMLHTGKTLYRLERHGQSIPEEHALLVETLKKAGYTSFGTGKWHNGIRSYARSFNTGAEFFSEAWQITGTFLHVIMTLPATIPALPKLIIHITVTKSTGNIVTTSPQVNTLQTCSQMQLSILSRISLVRTLFSLMFHSWPPTIQGVCQKIFYGCMINRKSKYLKISHRSTHSTMVG